MEDQKRDCSSCGGVAHPATGHAHSEETLICGPCARRWFQWLEKQTKRKFRVGKSKRFISFYS